MPHRKNTNSPGVIGRRLLDAMASRSRRLPLDWSDQLAEKYPGKRKSASAHMDSATCKLADALFAAATTGRVGGVTFSATTRRSAAVALHYFIDENDLFPDAVSDLAFEDDRQAIHWAARKLLGEARDVTQADAEPPNAVPVKVTKMGPKQRFPRFKRPEEITPRRRTQSAGRKIDPITRLSERDRLRIVGDLRRRTRELRGTWRKSVLKAYLGKRSEFAAAPGIDEGTVLLADRLFKKVAESGTRTERDHSRLAGAALQYLVDERDLAEDTPYGNADHLDDRFAIQWAARQIWNEQQDELDAVIKERI